MIMLGIAATIGPKYGIISKIPAKIERGMANGIPIKLSPIKVAKPTVSIKNNSPLAHPPNRTSSASITDPISFLFSSPKKSPKELSKVPLDKSI